MKLNRQIGDYVIYSAQENVAPFMVRLAGYPDDDEPISTHSDVTGAAQAIIQYSAADKRRAK